MVVSNKSLEKIVREFSLDGDLIDVAKFGNGHINKTFLVTTTKNKYILQQINNQVFKNVELLMQNIAYVSEYLTSQNITTLELVKTKKDKLYVEYKGKFFRVYKRIGHVYCFEGVTNLPIIEKYGKAFGQFHRNLATLDSKRIYDVIPDFHNTKKRYENLLKSLEKDPRKRSNNAKEIIDFLKDHANDCSILVDSLEDGSIRQAITHNDPKLNNILFDKTTLDVKCVVDLDTIMKGTYLFDFGDALRSLFTGEFEDTQDLNNITVNFDIYKSYVQGYYSQMKDILNAKEISLLPKSIVVITLELCIRFLTDYIDGDLYFPVKYDSHNLVRATTQYHLAKLLYENYDKLLEITNEICQG